MQLHCRYIVVAHLQAQAPPVLPCLQSDGCWWQHRDAWVEGRGISQGGNGSEVGYGFCSTWPRDFSKSAGAEGLAQLLRAFFARAAHVAAGELVASVRLGTFVRPSVLHWQPSCLFCIEDPVDPARNLGDKVTADTIQDLCDEIVRARSLLELPAHKVGAEAEWAAKAVARLFQARL